MHVVEKGPKDRTEWDLASLLPGLDYYCFRSFLFSPFALSTFDHFAFFADEQDLARVSSLLPLKESVPFLSEKSGR